MLHNFPFVHNVSRANTSEPSKSEKQTLVANSMMVRLARLLDLCSEGTWTDTSLTRHCESSLHDKVGTLVNFAIMVSLVV